MIDDSTEYIARISYGKDSLKMLDVIKSRGLPLDRITTTDVWATDTIPANLPPMTAFKERMDQRIWEMYHIEVEHLCAMNKDGTKKTYEQMFYHVPVRRSQTGQVERERERERRGPDRNNPRIPGPLEPVVSSWTQTDCLCTGYRGTSQDFLRTPDTTVARSSNTHRVGFRDSRSLGDLGAGENSRFTFKNQGFPAQISPWCRKLKIDKVRTPFQMALPRGAGKEISWNTWALRRTNRSGSGS